VLNGVTTMGAYVISEEPYGALLDGLIESLERHAVGDVFVHLPIFNERQLAEIPLYASRYGVKSFKAFMTGIPGIMPSLDEGFLLDLMSAVAEVGPDAVLNIHAENYHIVDWATARVKKAHPDGLSLAEWSETHPAFSEAEAIQRAVLLAEQTGAQVYFVHISSAEGVEMIRQFKKAGKRIWAETTSPYLTLSIDTELGALAKMVPPIRSEEDRAALWQGLKDDVLDTIGTDHTPMTVKEKRADATSLWDTMPGYPAVGTHLPSLIDAARRHDYDLLRLVEKLTLNPARIFGLFPRKGTLMPGSDADLVIVDPMRERVVSPDAAGSRADFALHQERTMIGWPVAVFKAGRPVIPGELVEGRSSVRGTYLGRS
jgi:dihydropyrimidinase